MEARNDKPKYLFGKKSKNKIKITYKFYYGFREQEPKTTLILGYQQFWSFRFKKKSQNRTYRVERTRRMYTVLHTRAFNLITFLFRTAQLPSKSISPKTAFKRSYAPMVRDIFCCIVNILYLVIKFEYTIFKVLTGTNITRLCDSSEPASLDLWLFPESKKTEWKDTATRIWRTF